MPSTTHIHTLPNGLLVYCPIVEQIQGLHFEVFTQRMYLQQGIEIQDGNCIFDVGANIGMFTLFIHHSIKNARIYAFEPIPRTFDMLTRTLSLNHLEATLYACGLSNITQTVPFTSYPRFSPLSGQFPEDIERLKPVVKDILDDNVRASEISATLIEKYFLKAEIVQCPVTTLSEVMHTQKIEQIDLLKIDTESSEGVILQGIQDADWPKIQQIVLEVHNDKLLDEVTSLLHTKHYDLITTTVGEKLYMVYAKQH